MTTKTKTVLLWPVYEFGELKGYRVQRITNTIEHAPGDFLTIPVVKDLCASKHWNVTIVAHGG